MRKFSRLLILLLAISANHHLLRAAEIPKSPKSGIAVSVNEKNGDYTIHFDALDWTWRGSVNQPLTDVQTSGSSDQIGAYAQISFRWKAEKSGAPLTAIIRRYNAEPTLRFSLRYDAVTNRAVAFPNFTQFPQGLHPFSFRDTTFAPPTFSLTETSTPWLFFNDKAESYIFAPASHFMIAKMVGDGTRTIGNSLNAKLTAIPQNFEQSSLLTISDGIHAAWLRYGNAQQHLANRHRPKNDADPLLKSFGYWTDRGAFYYYNYDLQKGYAETLCALREHYKQAGIPLGYMQLDSWWYEKTLTDPDGKKGTSRNPKLPEGAWNRYGGLLSYTADPALFPNELVGFQIGLPFVTHNRWVDPKSPYHQHFKISGLAAVDPKFWEQIADYCVKSHIICYEQDWLDAIYDNSAELPSTVNAADAFTDNMAAAMRARGISMQYCMAEPRYFLQGTKYDNLTTIRCSEDRFNHANWTPFLFTSQLAAAHGIWPWADVFKSTEIDNLILATLSAGPVGIGDELGKENRANIFRAIRSDGVIVKPDESLIPDDSAYIFASNKTDSPFLAWTYTQHANTRTLYFFAFPKTKTSTQTNFEIKPANYQLRGDVYIYDPLHQTGQKIGARETWRGTIGADRFSYLVGAPIGKSGIAFLGDKDKFVGTGKARITSIVDQPQQLTVSAAFANGESSVTLLGYSEKPLTASIDGASANISFDAKTGLFQIVVPANHHRTRNVVVETPHDK